MIKKRRKAKKFLSLLLSVAMALTIFAGVGQVEVKADEADSGAEVTHTDHEGWIDLNSISSIEEYNGLPQGKNFEYQGRYFIEEEGNYYLSSDIVSDNSKGAIQVGDGTHSCEVTICLNGHTISAGVGSYGVVRVMPKCQLTVVDCSTDKSGKIVESTNKGAAIYSKGNLKVNGVKDLSGKYGINAEIGQSVPDDSDSSAVSIEINDANITGTESSVYTSGVKTLAIKSTTCKGGVYALKSKNMTVEDSTINGAKSPAIKFWNGKGSKLVVDRSVLKTEATNHYVLDSLGSEGLVEIEVIDSELLSTHYGLKAIGGEKVTIRNSDIICAPAENDSNKTGHAINYQPHREAGRSNSLTIEGGKVRGINAGMSFGFNGNDPLDLTLSGTIDFGESNPSYPVFIIGYNGLVNLHMDELTTTDKLFIDIKGSGAGEISNVICDGDYSSYFVFPQYLVSGKATDNGKCLLNLTQRSITTQPTEENPQVAVNDTNNVTYQWYQADAVEKEVTDKSSDNTIAAERSCGSYDENGYWKPGKEEGFPYQYYIEFGLPSGGQIVLEAPTGSSLNDLEKYLWCAGGNAGGLVEKENVDGKLYFTIPSAGTYGIMSYNMEGNTYDCGFTGNEQIKITFKGIETKAVEGSTQSRLVTSKPGSFCCKATWAAGTPFEYSTVSDVVTVKKAIEPTQYAVTVTDGTPASAEYAAGETVTITANEAPEGKEFDKWEVVSGGVTLADVSQATTTFTMPENAVEVKATYKDVSGGTTKYAVTVTDGTTASAEYAAGETVTITADTAPEGKEFDKWEVVSGGVTLADASQVTTTFTMPENAVTVKATYKDASGEPTPEPTPGPSENGAEYILADGTKATFDETCTVTDKFGKYDSFKIYKGRPEGQEREVYFLIDRATHLGYQATDFTQYNSDLEAFKDSIASVVNAAGDEALDGMAKVIYGFTRIPVPSTVIGSHEHAWSEWKVDETNKNRMVSTCSGCDIKKYKNIETEEGSFEKEAEVGVDSPIQTATLNNGKAELLHSNIFGEGEKDKITGGADAKVWVVIDQKTALSDTDKTSMEEAAKTAVGNSDHMTYFDATLFKKVGNAPQSPVAEPGVEIKIAIRIPDSLINTDPARTRTYKIIRLHDGKADILGGIYDATTGEFTFTTDKFSTYAIVYSDASRPSGGSGFFGDSSSASSSAAVTKVTITPDKDTLTKAGETLQLTANFEPANAADKKVTWSSSDTSIATVDENGKVTAVGNGTVTITAKSSNGKTASVTITVALASETEKPETRPEETVETDIKMSTGFAALCPKYAKSTKTTNTLNWTKVSGADGYVVYGAPCNTRNQTNKLKKLATIKNGKATTYKATGLKSGTYYKYIIKAYKLVDGKKVYLAKSETIHVATAGGKYGNAESVKVNKTSVSLKTGEKFTIQASMVEKDQPVKQHAAIRFESSNSKVASVTSKGVIKAKSKGTCYIYVYAQNGVYKRIKVTVK